MDPVLARYARLKAPRYTSYPTAPHFSGEFREATYRDWLAALDPSEAISLYLHVPFCRQMCWYCGCTMKLVKREGPLEAYVEALLSEISLVRAALPGRMKVAHLHWGGGTPTALTPAQLRQVMERLRAEFDILPDAELAIESDPRTLTGEMAEALGDLGFTRASFGVQEFDAEVQRTINRIQPPQMVAGAVEALRARGIERINFDLIYGLPHQTVERLLRTVELSAEMAADRVALFGYAHVPWMARNQRMIPEAALPDAAERAAQASAAAEALVAAGYQAIGLDHFALPGDGLAIAAREGRLRRNFQGYTDDPAQTILGFGASAIGRTPWGYVQNLAETGAWSRRVQTGLLPVAKGLSFTGEDRLRGAVIERIMCDGQVDLAAMGLQYRAGQGWWSGARHRLRAMAADGLLELSGESLSLTDSGRPLARVVASVFDAYLADSAARHSVAV